MCGKCSAKFREYDWVLTGDHDSIRVYEVFGRKTWSFRELCKDFAKRGRRRRRVGSDGKCGSLDERWLES